MKILVLLSDAYGGHGGIAKFNRDLMAAMSSYKEDTKVVVFPRLIIKELSQRIPKNVDFRVDSVGGKFKYIYKVFCHLTTSGKYDLVVCGHVNLLPLAFIIKQMFRTKLCLVVHGVEIWGEHKSFFVRKILRFVNIIISVSKLTKNRMQEWANVDDSKFFILPNSIDKSLFYPKEKNQNLIDKYDFHDKKILMTLGRLDSEKRKKGFDEVIAALSRLKENYPDIIYMIVGDGPDKKRLEDLAVKYDVFDRVYFIGYVSEKDKIEFYNLSDCYVMPSQGEGFGIVILEALACGLPSIR